MAYTAEQIESLRKIQTKLKTPEAFQSYITEKYWADKLSEIKTNLQWTISTWVVPSEKITAKNNISQSKVSEINNKINPSTNMGDITSKINAWNSQAVLDRVNELKTSWKISDANYLPIKNKAQDVSFNEIKTWSPTDLVNTIPWKTWATTNADTTQTWTTVDTNNINTSQDASSAVTQWIRDNIAATWEQAQQFTDMTNQRIEEDKKTTAEREAQAKKFAEDQQALYKATDEKVQWLEKEIQTLIDERKWRDVADLEAKKQSEIDALKAQQELEKFKNEQTIKQAAKQVEVDKMRAAWAFNKMGVWFSSAAISTTSKIAIDWADKIAWLKLQAASNESGFAKDIAQMEFSYTKEINSTIDKYTDASINLKNQSIKRVYELQNNLLLSEKEKNDEINKIKDTLKKEVRQQENDLYAEMERLRDKQLEQVQMLEQQLIQQENTAKGKINDLIASGNWNKLSPIEKSKYLKQANITEAEANQSIKSTIYSSAYNLIQSTLWKDYLPSVAQMDNIQSEVERMMLAWRTMEEAINIATNRLIKSTPQYTAITTPKTSWSSTWAIKTSAMKQWDDWNWYAWTWIEWVNTWLKWKTTTTKPNEYQLEDWTIVRDDWTWVVTPIKTASWIIAIPAKDEATYWPKPFWTKIEYITNIIDLKANKLWTNQWWISNEELINAFMNQ